jgi:hypothetical protein
VGGSVLETKMKMALSAGMEMRLRITYTNCGARRVTPEGAWAGGCERACGSTEGGGHARASSVREVGVWWGGCPRLEWQGHLEPEVPSALDPRALMR